MLFVFPPLVYFSVTQGLPSKVKSLHTCLHFTIPSSPPSAALTYLPRAVCVLAGGGEQAKNTTKAASFGWEFEGREEKQICYYPIY